MQKKSKFEKHVTIVPKMSKILEKIACKPKHLAELEKISTDGVTLFLHLRRPGVSGQCCIVTKLAKSTTVSNRWPHNVCLALFARY